MFLRLVHTSSRSLMMKAVGVIKPGGSDQLCLVDVARPVPERNQVLMKTHMSAVNRADVLQRQGKYPPPAGESEILGLEAAGVVESVGADVKRWKKGDRVMALLAGGGNAEYTVVHEDHVLAVPDNLSYSEAAAIPEAWLTAYQLLHFVGKIKEGESVLIHAGGSGVGTAAVQLARQAQLNVYVTAGSQNKINHALQLGACAGCNYKEENFVEVIKNQTKGKGVNVVLDCIGGSYWEQNCSVLSSDGRWVMYGSLGGVHVNGNLFAKILQKRLLLIGSTLRSRSVEYKSELVRSFSENVLDGFRDGRFKPVISQVLPFHEVSKAHQMMESNANIGKIVLQLSTDVQ